MIAVFDSNTLFQDFWLDKPHFRLVREQARAGTFQVVTPEVIVRETINNYRREITTAVERLDKDVKRVRGYRMSVDLVALDVDEQVRRYGEHLRGALNGAGARTVDTPDVELDDIVDRAVAGRRPFRGHDQGFRDTLIWHTVLELAATDHVVLISDNSEDFGSGETVHDDLAAELGGRRVDLLHSVERFVELHVPPSAQALSRVQARLAEGEELHDNLRRYLELAAGSLEIGTRDAHLRVPSGADTEGAEVQHVEVTDIAVDTAHDLVGDELVVDGHANVVVTVDFFIPKWELYEHEARTGGRGFVIQDSDWNESYAWATIDVHLGVVFAAEIAVDGDAVRDLDIITTDEE